MKFFKVTFSLLILLSLCMLSYDGVKKTQSATNRNNIIKIIDENGVSGDRFGSAVSQDQNVVIVGAPYQNNRTGTVCVYNRTGDTFTQQTVTIPDDSVYGDNDFGYSVSIHGNYAIVGAPSPSHYGMDESCSVHILYGPPWNHVQRIDYPDETPYPFFGGSVSINEDYAVVGAKREDGGGVNCGAIYLYKESSTQFVWVPATPSKLYPLSPKANINFGHSVSMYDDTVIVVGAPADTVNDVETGSAYICSLSTQTWVILPATSRLVPDDGQEGDQFGYSVSIEGNNVIVGAPYHDVNGNTDAGAAYIFMWNGIQWVQHKLTASDGAYDDRFGTSVSINGDYAIIGAPYDDHGCGTLSGSSYVFRWNGTTWLERELRPQNCVYDSNFHEEFGTCVSIGTGYAIIGAPRDDHDDYESKGDAGASYVFMEPYTDDRYFVHIADLHVVHEDNVWWGEPSYRWERELEEILKLRPAPEFVTVAGDLVDWGEGGKGDKNYDALLDSYYLQFNLVTGVNYLTDGNQSIRIIFCPGNHDYRYSKYWPTSMYPTNYVNKIYPGTYSENIIGNYAIFSLDSGFDQYSDPNDFLPEGSGLSNWQMENLANDLYDLSGDDNDYIKIIMMHHPHENPFRPAALWDGEFLHKENTLRNLCNQYGVDFVLYGHLHKKKVFNMAQTTCLVPKAAEDGNHMEISLYSTNPWYESIQQWSVINVTYLGNVETYGLDQFNNRTGVDSDTLLQFGITDSKYSIYFFNSHTGNPEKLAKISVIKAGTMDYRFIAEALCADEITITVEEFNDDGTSVEISYPNVLMKYENGKGSVATLYANASQVDYRLIIVDPYGQREIMPEMQWVVRDIDLFQDTFPTGGVSTGTGRIDAALDIAPQASLDICPGDSAIVTVYALGGGLLEPEPYTNFGAAVYCYMYRDLETKPMPLDKIVEDSFRWPLVDSVLCDGHKWYMFRCDTAFTEASGPRTGAVPNKFCIDLNDNFFTNGDTLFFFFGAEDVDNHWTWWSEDAGAVTDISLACAAPMEMQILPGAGPARGGDILFVDNFGGSENQSYFDLAFEMLGIADKVDRFDKRSPSLCIGNSIGDRCSNVINQLIPYYRKIIWNSGNLYGGTIGGGSGSLEKADDFSALFTFLDQHTSTGGVGIYFSGDDIAEEWANNLVLDVASAVNLSIIYMPFELINTDHSIEHGLVPFVIGRDGGIFDHSVPDTMIACGRIAFNDFDVIQPLPPSTLEMAYDGEPDNPAVIACATFNPDSIPVKVVLSGFSFHYISDDRPYPGIVPDPVHHLMDIIQWLGNILDYWVAVDPTPQFANRLDQNYPNPFNPITTIKYSIKERTYVSLKIYNVAGQLVKTLVDEEQVPRIDGFTVRWNGRSNSGQEVASGVYFYRLATKGFTESKKLMVLK